MQPVQSSLSFDRNFSRSSGYRVQQPWVPTSEAIFAWDDAFHDLMLGDRLRMEAYRQAIFATVRPGDVVVDLGVGTGILSYWAIEAGARLVYGIEMNDAILDRALASLSQAGMADRFHPVRGISYDVSLPQRADVLISEIIGNLGDNENIQAILADATARFVKPGARCIPEWVDSWIVPIEADEAHDAVRRGSIAVLNAEYEIDSLRRGRKSSSLFDLYYDCIIAESCRLSEATCLQRLGGDWNQPTSYRIDKAFRIGRSGQFTGFKAFFKAQLSPDRVLDISGDDIAARSCSDSWKHAFLPIEIPIACHAGDVLDLEYTRQAGRAADTDLSQIYTWQGVLRRHGRIVGTYSQSTA